MGLLKRTPLSYTRMKTWFDCRFLFDQLYHKKLEQRKDPAMLIGSAVHGWAEKYVKQLMKARQEKDEVMGLQLFERLWQEREADKELRLLPEAHHDETRGLVAGFLKNHTFEPDNIAGAELELAFNDKWELTEWMAPDVFFRLKMDRLELAVKDGKKVITVFDYKTGWAIESEEASLDNPQMKLYAMGAEVFLGGDEYRAVLDYVRMNVQRQVTIPIEVAREERKRVEAVSRQVEKAKEKNAFEATPGPACAYCPAFSICPKRATAQQYKAPTTAEEAGQVMQSMILLDKQLGETKALLKEWTKINGPVVYQGAEYGPKVLKKRNFDLEAVAQWATEHALPLGAFAKVDNEALDKLMDALKKKGRTDALDSLPAAELVPYTDTRVRKAAGERGSP